MNTHIKFQKKILFYGFFSLIFVFAILFSISSGIEEYQYFLHKNEEIEKRLQQSKHISLQSAFKKKSLNYSQFSSSLIKKYPNDWEENQFLNTLKELVKTNKLQLISHQDFPIELKATFKIKNISLSIQGTYQNFVSFFQDLDDIERGFVIQKLEFLNEEFLDKNPNLKINLITSLLQTKS